MNWRQAFELPPEEEKGAGITTISLANARKLIDQFGLPDTVRLWDEPVDAEFYVTASWSKAEFVFSGFSWGYDGEGPQGLQHFFTMIGCQPPIDGRQIRKWPMTDFNKTLVR